MPLLTLFVCSRPIQGRPACWGPWDWSAIPRNSWGEKISVKNRQSLITSRTRWSYLCVDHFVVFLHEMRFALQHEGHLELVPLLSEQSIGKQSQEANGSFENSDEKSVSGLKKSTFTVNRGQIWVGRLRGRHDWCKRHINEQKNQQKRKKEKQEQNDGAVTKPSRLVESASTKP